MRAAIGLIVILFALFVLVLALSTFQARRDARQRAVERATTAAQVVDTNARWITQLAWQALRHIDDALGPDVADGKGQTVRDIRAAVEGLPGAVKAYVVDANGDTLFSTDAQVKAINITDREYFSTLAAGAPSFVSPLLVSRLNGQQIFVFSRRLERNGKFAGAAILSFDVLLLAEVWASLALDDQSTVSLIRDDGQLVARYPLADGPLDMSRYVLFTDYLKQSPTGSYDAVSPVDGVTRIVGYRKVADTNLVAVASISTASAYALFWRNTLVTLLLALPTALALVAASIWIARLLQRDAGRQLELTQALKANTLLFRDTHHRVKNNLQSVQSLVRMQDIPDDAKMDLQGRIAAMTAVHEHIYRLDQYREVEAHQFIPAIVEPLVRTYGADVRFEYDIAPLAVDRDHATPLALLVNEVVTNALKYAFPNHRAGMIRISLKPADNERGILTISDDGVGFDTGNATAGMGSRLVRGMVVQLEGTSSYVKENGTRFTADISLRARGQVPAPKAAAASS